MIRFIYVNYIGASVKNKKIFMGEQVPLACLIIYLLIILMEFMSIMAMECRVCMIIVHF